MLPPKIRSNAVVLLLDEVLRLHGRMVTAFAGANDSTGLSPTELTVLNAVAEAPVPPTVPRIGRSLGYQRQTVQRAANALVAAGLVRTAPNPDHVRAALLVPTQKGLELMHEAAERASKVVGALSLAVDEDRCGRVTEEMRALRREIEDHLRAEGAARAGSRRPVETSTIQRE
jgi:DNA-binding MarR family transcriptional regulator